MADEKNDMGLEPEKKCCGNSCFSDCNPCKPKDAELDYDSDKEKGAQPEKDMDFSKPLEASDAHCRVKKTGRRPRDCICSIIFFVFILGMIYVTYHAFSRGDPRRLYMPTDFMGRICGLDNSGALPHTLKLPLNRDCVAGEKGNATAKELCERAMAPFKINLSEQRFLWFMSPLDPMTYGGICVSYCPGARNKTSSAELIKPRHCPPELNQLENSTILQRLDIGLFPVCTYERPDNPNVTFPPTSQEITFSSFVPYTSLLRRCIPDPTFSSGRTANSTVQQQFDSATSVLTELWGDIVRSWKVIVVGTLLSLVVSFVFLTLIRLFTGLLVWVTVFATFVFLAGLSAITTWQGYTLWQNATKKQLNTVIPKVVFGIGIGIGGITILYAILMLFLFIRIRKAIGIISEASKAISAMPQIVLLPVVLVILYAIFLIYWIFVAVFLWSAGTPSIENQAVRFTLDTFSQAIFAYHIFALLWVSNIFLAYEYTVVAGAVGSWYWRKDKRLIIPDPVVKSAVRTLVFHFGSITFGALLVAIIQFIRFLLDRAYRKVKQAVDNKDIARCYYAAQGFIFLFENVIKFINKHAYIQIAIYGNSFFYAAYNAFSIIFRNAVQIGVVEFISNIILMLGRVVIAAATAVITWGLLQLPFMIEDSDFDTTPLLVPVLVFIIAFVIASLFMTILSCAVDTVLQCFLIDYEMCTADKNRKPYCTSSLSQFIAEARIATTIADKFACHACICLTCDCLTPKTPDQASDLAGDNKSINNK